MIPMFDSRTSYLAVAVVAVAPQAAVALQRADVAATSKQTHIVRAEAFVEDGYRLDPERCFVNLVCDDGMGTDDAKRVVAPAPDSSTDP